jgi:carbonic anhydrase/acetyltransferase-like protein (isoleucine patch superfamily)
MEFRTPISGIRPNPAGDWPTIDDTAFVDPSAQIMGNVYIGPGVYVGPQAVIRADELTEDGDVEPVVVHEDAFIQDGVVIHARAGSRVTVGSRSNIAHGVIIHGPCTIGEECFIALRASIYNSNLEEKVWVGIGAIVMRATVPSHTMIPAGAMVRSGADIQHFRLMTHNEQAYKDGVIEASAALRDGYLALYRDGLPQRDGSE